MIGGALRLSEASVREVLGAAGISFAHQVLQGAESAAARPQAASMRPAVKVKPFDVALEKGEDGAFMVSWDTVQKGLDMRVSVEGTDTEVYARSEAGRVLVQVPPNGVHAVRVSASCGEEWVPAGSVLFADAVVPARIDRQRTRFQGKKLVIKMCEPLPASIESFLYAAKTKAHPAEPAPWLVKSRAVVGQNDVRKIRVADYKRLGEIVYSETNDISNEYYVSVCSEYRVDGKTVLSEPDTIRLMRPMHVTVHYSLTHSWFRRNPVLDVTFRAKRLTRLPRMVLCCGKGDLYIRAHDDPDAITLMVIEEEYLHAAVDYAERSYPLKFKVLRGTQLSLFIPDASGIERYRVLPAE